MAVGVLLICNGVATIPPSIRAGRSTRRKLDDEVSAKDQAGDFGDFRGI